MDSIKAERPDVSIVLPVYKVEKYIRPSVDSVLSQTHRNIEIILVDDGSPDNSGSICDEFAAQDARVRVIHKQNAGTGEARNTGMDAARGEYIYFCDPDDILDPRLIEDNLDLARRYDADIVTFGCWSQETDGENRPVSERVEEPMARLEGAYPYREFWENFEEDMRCTSTLWLRLFRLAPLREKGLRATRLSRGQDSYFLYDVFSAGFDKIVYNPRRYYTYIKRPGSARKSFDTREMEDDYKLTMKFERMVRETSGLEQRYERLIWKRYCYIMLRHASKLTRGGDMSRREKIKILRNYVERPEMRSALKKVGILRGGYTSHDIAALMLMRLRMYGTYVIVRGMMGAGRTGV